MEEEFKTILKQYKHEHLVFIINITKTTIKVFVKSNKSKNNDEIIAIAQSNHNEVYFICHSLSIQIAGIRNFLSFLERELIKEIDQLKMIKNPIELQWNSEFGNAIEIDDIMDFDNKIDQLKTEFEELYPKYIYDGFKFGIKPNRMLILYEKKIN